MTRKLARKMTQDERMLAAIAYKIGATESLLNCMHSLEKVWEVMFEEAPKLAELAKKITKELQQSQEKKLDRCPSDDVASHIQEIFDDFEKEAIVMQPESETTH